MKNTRYISWILVTEGVGLLSGLLSRQSTRLYSEMVEKPGLSPPAVFFPVVWSILYALMGFGAARVYTAPFGPGRSRALNVFVVQLIVNFFWSLIFFNARAFGFALLWLLFLWMLLIVMILLFWPADRLAAILQIPYLLWVTFAAYLNYGVWQMNR